MRTRKIFFYIVQEILTPLGMALVVFTFILLIGRIFRLSDLVINKGVNLFDVLKLFVYILPNFLIFTIPMAFLLGVLLAFGRLSSDHELTAMKASGISLFQLIPPVITVSLLCYGVAALMAIYALPWGSRSFRDGLYEIARTKAHIEFKPRVFNDSFSGLVFYVDGMNPRGDRMEGVLIQDERDKEKSQVILSKVAQLASDPERGEVILILQDGSIHIEDEDKRAYRKIDFDYYHMRLDIEESLGGGRRIRTKDSEKSIGELKKEIERKKASGEDYVHEMVVINEKYAIPFACIVFGLLGVPLGVLPPRSGRSYSLIKSLAIIMAYYVLMTATEALAERGILRPWVSTWIPNVFFLLVGIYLLVLRGREKQSKFSMWVESLVAFVAPRMRIGR
ncbi:MAG: LPS export ABC transporter permease LptF [Proteobacteria bacterium]|nr:LPS export ABC transporter permease LptF [Pseudomonadota bacterium]